MTNPTLSGIDRLVCNIDRALRTLTPRTQALQKNSPAEGLPEAELSDTERRKISGLMRVNHAGEVCAQALYQGQALTARASVHQQHMQEAADEEVDHLAWCEERLKELGSHTSVLNPAWYTMSFLMGAGAGLLGDKISLGFVAATEEGVGKHLQEHQNALPAKDERSKAIIAQMLEDELRHKDNALAAGGKDFSTPVKNTMQTLAKLMTKSSYHV